MTLTTGATTPRYTGASALALAMAMGWLPGAAHAAASDTGQSDDDAPIITARGADSGVAPAARPATPTPRSFYSAVAAAPATRSFQAPTARAAARPAPLVVAANDDVTSDARVREPTSPPPGGATITNPFRRDVDLTLALSFNDNALGELPVTLTAGGHVLANAAGFKALINPLLSPAGRVVLADTLGPRETFEPDVLHAVGIDLEYDPAALAVVIRRIDPQIAAVNALFDAVLGQPAADIAPNDFSAYVNTTVSTSWSNTSGTSPYLDLEGVARYKGLVFESDFVGQDNAFGPVTAGSAPFTVQRRYVRLVYDQPSAFRRFFIGEVTPLARAEQGSIQLGGIGVARVRQTFDPFNAMTLSGSQHLLLSRDATIQVLDNGALVRQFKLNAGSYDLGNLPLQTGSNNIQINIRDVTGATRTVDYSTYVDSLDLLPGDYEYAAYAGVISDAGFSQTPHYTGGVAFTGFFRKAFHNRTAAGLGLQASSKVQMVDGEYRLILPGGAEVVVGAAASHARAGGDGEAFSLLYNFVYERADLFDGLSAQVRYRSRGFQVLGDTGPMPAATWQASASYSHSFTRNDYATANINYFNGVSGGGSYLARITNNYRYNSRWTFEAGVTYQKNGFAGRDGFGVLLGLIWRPSFDRVVEARYDSRLQSETVNLIKSSDNYVGSVGYSLQASHQPGQANVTGEVNYVGNRFDAALSEQAFGDGFNSITKQSVTTASISSSLAFTGGKFAVGRRIADSFAIAYPHENLQNRPVVVGDDLESGHYIGKSDAFGPAVDNFLASYALEPLHYDVLNPPQGYDVGPGILLLKPGYRSGYSIKVGMDAFMSATGTLVGADGKPQALVSGRVIAANDASFKGGSFFTNSAGRFAIPDLKPGVRYRVEVNGEASFEFTTPKNGKAFVDLNTVAVPGPGR